MKKLLFIVAIICITTISANAQIGKPTTINIGVDAGIPIGTLSSNLSSFVIGGSLQGDFKVAPELALTLSGGYLNWSGKNGIGSVGFIPILGGIKYYFSPKVYGSGQLGVSFATESGGGSYFTYIPGVGFKVSNNFDILVKYTGMSNSSNLISSLNNVGVRLAYSF